MVAYREFTAEGFWHEPQDYGFAHNCSRREKTGEGMLSPFWGEWKRREEEQRSRLLSLVLGVFFTIVLADSYISART